MTGTTEVPGASSRALEARKHAADEDAEREEAKRSRGEQRSEVPQWPSLQVADTERSKGVSEERPDDDRPSA
jgi:hypothetical protein